jgi:hypothetical protein
MDETEIRATAFDGLRLLAAGPLVEVALAVRAAVALGPVLVFDDRDGRVIDLDLRGSEDDLRRRLAPSRAGEGAEAPRGRGRPRLGVTAREVTLLPRHWDWLAAQPGGASVTLRRLIDEARQREQGAAGKRAARDAAYRFAHALAGDLPGFEEAARSLFAGDHEGLARHTAPWPADVRAYLFKLAAG